MYAGEIVERAPVDELFDNPQHPYTVGLLASIPRLDRRVEQLATIEGSLPDMADVAAGLPLRRALPVRDRGLHRRAAADRDRSTGHWSRCLARRCDADGVMSAPLLEVEGLVRHFVARVRRSAGRPPPSRRSTASLHARGRPDAGARRRIRLRQIHRRPADAAADRADRRNDPLRRPRHRRARREATARLPPRRADRLPGPLRVAQSAHDGRADADRAAGAARHRAGRRSAASASPSCCVWSVSSRASRGAIRTNSPAASASASPSRARSRSSRSSSSATSRCPRSTSRSARRSSIC